VWCAGALGEGWRLSRHAHLEYLGRVDAGDSQKDFGVG
jgi:hypothetical protein